MEEIDCSRALHVLYQFLDGELTVERRANIEGHLKSCEHCFSAFDFEVELRMVVRSRLQTEVPSFLRQRVLDALATEGCSPLLGPSGGGLPQHMPLGSTGAPSGDDLLPRFGL